MDDALVRMRLCSTSKSSKVLILVVMDDALVLTAFENYIRLALSLNPCCNG